MPIIIMKTWRTGLQKISLTHLQVDLLGMSLTTAKNNVDNLLNGQIVRIKIDNENVAKDFVQRAEKIGVECTLEN